MEATTAPNKEDVCYSGSLFRHSMSLSLMKQALIPKAGPYKCDYRRANHEEGSTTNQIVSYPIMC